MIFQGNETERSIWLQHWFYKLLTAGIIINVLGLFITILEPDGALYAAIAKTIAQTGDFINLRAEGKEWLDKPHFPFWMAAISYKIFGINTFAYKFPALLFWGMGLYYTYRLASSVYNQQIARLAVLIYITAAHLVISNNDVRAEPYLIGLMTGSIFHFYRASDKKISWHLVAGSLLAACAVMTKGPYVLITIGGGFIPEWVMKKKWAEFGMARWWIAIVLIFVFILPELYCLYVQFDLHPEKIVFNKTGVSGIKFFFWDSQFGRFFNTGPIKGKGDYLFYFHTLLWAFLPWSLLLMAAFIWKVKKIKNSAVNPEYLVIATISVTFMLFSFSRFQLPHYINILFPFFAIITAQYLYSIHEIKTIRLVKWVQYGVNLLVLSVVVLLVIFFRPAASLLVILWIGGIVILALLLFKRQHYGSLYGYSFFTAILVFGFLNLFFYPALLKYQSGTAAAYFINDLQPKHDVVILNSISYSLDFYLERPLFYRDIATLKNKNDTIIVFTQANLMDSLLQRGYKTRTLKKFPHFHISQLSPAFINYKTRASVLQEYVVAEVIP